MEFIWVMKLNVIIVSNTVHVGHAARLDTSEITVYMVFKYLLYISYVYLMTLFTCGFADYSPEAPIRILGGNQPSVSLLFLIICALGYRCPYFEMTLCPIIYVL